MNNPDPRIKRTLSEIDSAFLTLLGQYSIQGITVDMICREARINRSTFYKHYRNKADMLQKFLDRTISDFDQHMDVCFILASPSRIDDAIYIRNFSEALEFMYSRKDLYRRLWNAETGRDVFTEMADCLCNKMLASLKAETGACGTAAGRTAGGASAGAVSAGAKRDTICRLYARLFASNAMDLIKWGFENSAAVSMQEVNAIMVRNMRDGLFRSFRELVQ